MKKGKREGEIKMKEEENRNKKYMDNEYIEEINESMRHEVIKNESPPKKKKNTGAKNLTKNKKGPDNIPDEEEGVVDLGESYADNVC